MNQLTIEYRGKQITATLNRGKTATTGQALPSEEPAMWYLTIGGTALTKLAASASDTEDGVRARVVQWLKEHPDMLDRDQIVLGGG
jgi:hypothetical protein